MVYSSTFFPTLELNFLKYVLFIMIKNFIARSKQEKSHLDTDQGLRLL